MAAKPNVPTVLWAQRKDFVLLKIDLPDVKNEKIEVDGAKVKFNGESQGRSYSVELDLHADVVKEESKWTVRPRATELKLKKKDAVWWPRCLKVLEALIQHKPTHYAQAGKPFWLKVDFNLWREEDDGEEDVGEFGGSDFGAGFPGMGGGMPGMGGMGGGMGGMEEMMKSLGGGMGGMGGMGGAGMDDDDSDGEEGKKPAAAEKP